MNEKKAKEIFEQKRQNHFLRIAERFIVRYLDISESAEEFTRNQAKQELKDMIDKL